MTSEMLGSSFLLVMVLSTRLEHEQSRYLLVRDDGTKAFSNWPEFSGTDQEFQPQAFAEKEGQQPSNMWTNLPILCMGG